MRFRLHYKGPLKSNGRAKDKQRLRRAFLPQLRDLWDRRPLVDQKAEFLRSDYELSAIKSVREWNFASVVNSKNNLVAELDILVLDPEEPGAVITQGGDIDNRLKTLFDALSIPRKNQIPDDDAPAHDEDPFHCLLEDDNLITGVRVTVDRLLGESEGSSDVAVVICVDVRCTRLTMENLGFSQ